MGHLLVTFLHRANADLLKLSFASFTFNTSALVVENCLLSDISDLLTHDEILNMSLERLALLTSEHPSTADERREWKKEEEDLKEALCKCREKLGSHCMSSLDATPAAQNLTIPTTPEHRRQSTSPVLSPSFSSSSSSSTVYSGNTNRLRRSVSRSEFVKAMEELEPEPIKLPILSLNRQPTEEL
jgi:hypothetical protein